MIDFCDVAGLIPVEMALAKLLATVKPVTQTDTVDLAYGIGRVLAMDIRSTVAVPPHDNSSMDGYALRAQDLADHHSLTQIGEVLAGHPFNGQVAAGQCVRIMTGGMMPQGVDTVIMQERAQVDGQQVSFSVQPTAGDNVRRQGEDIAINAVVLRQGRLLNAADIGLLASLGIAQVGVYRRLKVALFSTGDELKTPGQPLAVGDIYESNRFTVAAMLSRLPIDIIHLGIVADDPAKLTEAFLQADAVADVVISSGGVSVGDADYTKDILQQQGEIGFWKLAIKPGKPFAFGVLQNSYFMGLPGNPVSAMVTFHQLAVPALRRLMGQQAVKPLRFNAQLTSAISKRPGRTDFQRGIFSVDDHGAAVVTSTGAQGSGILTSMSAANCYIILPKDSGSVDAGSMVCVELFDQIIG